MLRRVLEVVGVGLVLTGCGGGSSDRLVAPPDTPVLTALSVTLSAPTVYVGSSVTASAAGTDQHGASIATGTVTWSTGTPGVATVGSDGKVTAVAPGTTTVIAAAGTKQAQATLTVKQPPVARVAVVPASASIVPGATQQLTVTALDASGNPLTGRAVTWMSSDTATATVDSTGLVTGVSIGRAKITATSETQSDSAAIAVIAPPPAGGAPTILSIAPPILTPGATVTITGTGFSTLPTSDTLTIDGVAAVVKTASAAQLTATVPTALPCSPTHGAAVQVAVGQFSAAGTQTLRTGTPATLAVGGSVVITSAGELACLELPPASGDYVVSVFNDLRAPTSIAAFRLAGAGSGATPDRAAPVMLRQSVARPARPPALPADLMGLPESPAMHLRVLEASRNAYAMLRGTDRVRPALSRSVVGQPAFATVPTVGTTRTFRVNQFTTTLGATGSCSSYKEITARVAYVGTKSIIWEDVAAPLAGTMDSYFTKLGQEFDSTMYRSDSTYFGDPLVTDPYTDGDHHLDMVFTPSVPSGVAGFVIACDLFPRDSVNDPSSNFGEFFYAVVPTVAGTGYSNSGTADAWLWGIRTTVVHEVKHIASFGARLTNGATSFEESWLEEGMAREAEAVWLRNNIYDVPWKGDSRYANTLYCDVRPSFAQCAGKPYGMFNHFNTLYSVLRSPGASSLFGRVADNDFNFYALAWSFSRWADDRYATSDASFLRGITQATTTGMASISALTGQSVDDMLGHWTLSLDLDGDAAFASDPDVQFPTWNTRDIYAGMSSDFLSYFPQPFPLTPLALPAGSFAVDNAGIHGGAFAMYELTTSATAGQTLSLLGPGGAGPASFSLRIAIARKQ